MKLSRSSRQMLSAQLKARRIALAENLIIFHIIKTEFNNCFIVYILRQTKYSDAVFLVLIKQLQLCAKIVHCKLNLHIELKCGHQAQPVN